MAIHRVPGPPRVILSDIKGTKSLFEVLLTQAARARPEGLDQFHQALSCVVVVFDDENADIRWP